MAKRQGVSPRQINQNRIPVANSMICIGVGGKEATARNQRDTAINNCQAHYNEKIALDKSARGHLESFNQISEQLNGMPKKSPLAKLGIPEQTKLFDAFAIQSRRLQERIAYVHQYLDTAAEKTKEVDILAASRKKPAADIFQLVKKHPLVCGHNKITFSNDGWVTFTTNPLIMRPNANPYKFIDDGERPYIKLGKMNICLNMETGALNIYSATRNSIRKASYGGHPGSSTPHPHVLGDRKPCLGDFASPLSEALSGGDIEFALDVIKSFLEQAANEDSAGCRWVMWIIESKDRARDFANDPYFYDRTLNKYIKFKTFPDGSFREIHVDQPPIPTEEIVPGIYPPTLRYDFWDGRSIPKTGQIIRTMSSTGYAAWYKNQLYVCDHHPASRIDGRLVLPEGNYTLNVPENEKFDVYRTIINRSKGRNIRQHWWAAWDHDHEVPVGIDEKFLYENHWYVNATIQMKGPMSRSITATAGMRNGEPTAPKDWDDGLVIITPAQTKFPQPQFLPLTLLDFDNPKIGQIVPVGSGDYMLWSLPGMETASNGYSDARILNGLPWATISKTNWAIKPPRALDLVMTHGHVIPAFCRFVATGSSISEEKLQTNITRWNNIGAKEEHFEPWLWEIVKDRIVSKQKEMVDTKIKNAKKAIRVDFKDGNFITVYGE